MDTERTTSELASLLADNGQKQISAQDLRDAVATLFGGYGSMYMVPGSAAMPLTATPATITAYDTEGPKTSGVYTNGVAVNTATGEITIGQAGIYLVSFSMSASAAGNFTDVTLGLYGDGLLKPNGEYVFSLKNAGNIEGAAFTIPEPVAAGEVLTMRASVGTTETLTLRDLSFGVKRIG